MSRIVGVIFGTGCNAAYMEKVGNVPKMKHLGLPDDADIAINCRVPCTTKCGRLLRHSTGEWGAFDSEKLEVLPRTKYDNIIDETSNKPGEQAFEKCACCTAAARQG
jgi:hexokinase